jgi:hypothetical protein
MDDLQRLTAAEGLDRLATILTESFGQEPSGAVMQELFENVSMARHTRTLTFAYGVGLTTTQPLATRATPVRSNTFFGAP